MSLLVFTVLIGGSMVVTTIVWVYLLAITVQQYRGTRTGESGTV